MYYIIRKFHLLPSDDKTFGVKYLGSKLKILPDIWNLIRPLNVQTAIDVFSGTTRVAQYLRKKGVTMTTSDLSWATTCYAYTYVHNHENDHLKDFIKKMNNLPPKEGWLSQNYTGNVDQNEPEGDGRCFQLKNAAKADAARDWIDEQSLKDWERHTLITSVINALDAVDNTVGVQQAYLKKWCARSSNDIVFKLPDYVEGPIGTHHEGDCLNIEYDNADLAYLDPPYSPHSYATYYHIWDSIAKWDKPDTALKAKRRVDRVAKHKNYDQTMESPWNRPNQAMTAFDHLIKRLPVRYILISYNDESIISESELKTACEQHGQVTSQEVVYNRNIMSQIGNATRLNEDVEKKQKNRELLYLVDKKC